MYDAVCDSRNIASVKKCVDEGADINEPNRHGWSSLHLAANHGCEASLFFWDLNKRTNDYGCVASSYGHVEVVQALIEQGDDVVDVNKPTINYLDCFTLWT